jgi:hypothetical protein
MTSKMGNIGHIVVRPPFDEVNTLLPELLFIKFFYNYLLTQCAI